jgi:hypothetical protein
MSIGQWISGFSLALIAMLANAQSTNSGTVDAQQKALQAIKEFANDICNRVPTAGTQKSVDLDASAQAELSRLLKIVGNLGFSSGAKYSRSDYNGILQADLAKALHDEQECRLEVFRRLQDKLLVSPPKSSNDAARKGAIAQPKIAWRQPSESPNSFAIHWLSFVDNAEWDKAYGHLTQEMKDSYTEREFASLLQSARGPRGHVVTRTFLGSQPAQRTAITPPNIKGFVVAYDTTFERRPNFSATPGEFVVLSLSPEGVYRVISYMCQLC